MKEKSTIVPLPKMVTNLHSSPIFFNDLSFVSFIALGPIMTALPLASLLASPTSMLAGHLVLEHVGHVLAGWILVHQLWWSLNALS